MTPHPATASDSGCSKPFLDPAFKAPSRVLEVRSISVPAEELWHPAMAIEKEDEEEEADDGARNAATI